MAQNSGNGEVRLRPLDQLAGKLQSKMCICSSRPKLTKAPDLGSREAYLGAQLPPYLGCFQLKHTGKHSPPQPLHTQCCWPGPQEVPCMEVTFPKPLRKREPRLAPACPRSRWGGCGGWDNPIRTTVELHSLLLNAGCCLDS